MDLEDSVSQQSSDDNNSTMMIASMTSTTNDMTDEEPEEEVEEDDYEYEYEYSDEDEDLDDNADEKDENYSDFDKKNGSKRTSSAMVSTARQPEKPITMIASLQLRASLERQVSECVDALGVPKEAAAPLLQHSQYNLQQLLQRYADQPSRVLSQAGVANRCSNSNDICMKTVDVDDLAEDGDDDCLICMEPLTKSNSMTMPCQHTFCLDCWQDYLTNLANFNGPSFVTSTCPQQGCPEVITQVEVQAAAPELLEKFQYYQLQSFVESNPLLKWCPGKGCDCIAKAVSSRVLEEEEDAKAVHCTSCNTEFCMVCSPNEPHSMISCKTLQRWKDKNSNESETSNWILANTKNCPHCDARIHKDGGCMYVTCSKCKKGFCWMCKGTHHVWQCNSYKANTDAETEVAKAKNELERYLHYYERYHGHDKAQKFAQKQLNKLIKEELQNENNTSSTSSSKKKKKEKDTSTTTAAAAAAAAPSLASSGPKPMEVDKAAAAAAGSKKDDEEEEENHVVDVRLPALLKEANQQLVQCRRVLKFSYVFAFYHFVPTTTKDQQHSQKELQKQTFEHHQGILEGLTEGLSKITETKQRHKINLQDVTNRTRVIGQFIKNVLENVQEMTEQEADEQQQQKQQQQQQKPAAVFTKTSSPVEFDV